MNKDGRYSTKKIHDEFSCISAKEMKVFSLEIKKKDILQVKQCETYFISIDKSVNLGFENSRAEFFVGNSDAILFCCKGKILLP